MKYQITKHKIQIQNRYEHQQVCDFDIWDLLFVIYLKAVRKKYKREKIRRKNENI